MFRVKVNADMFFNVDAKDKLEARNKVLKELEHVRKIAGVDVSAMTVVEADENSEEIK